MEDSKPPPYSCSFDQGGHREKAVGTLTLPKAPVGVDTRGPGGAPSFGVLQAWAQTWTWSLNTVRPTQATSPESSVLVC